MAGVLCMHCGSGDDDDLLLLCDGAPVSPVWFCCSGILDSLLHMQSGERCLTRASGTVCTSCMRHPQSLA